MRTNKQKTTQLGELVATVFDEAARHTIDPREVSHLAMWALANIFRRHDSTVLADNMSTQRPVIRAMR
jgi:hypothetical protein